MVGAPEYFGRLFHDDDLDADHIMGDVPLVEAVGLIVVVGAEDGTVCLAMEAVVVGGADVTVGEDSRLVDAGSSVDPELHVILGEALEKHSVMPLEV